MPRLAGGQNASLLYDAAILTTSSGKMSPSTMHPPHNEAFAPLFAILAMIIVGTSVLIEGPILSYGGDSAYYACISANLAAGNGLINCSGTPLTGQPPLLPILVAALLKAGLGLVDAARVLCICFAGLAGYCAARLLGMAIRPPWLFLLAAITAVVHPPLVLWQTVGIMTDGPFAGLVAFSLLALALYLRHEKTGIAWVALALAMTAAIRYFGLPIVIFAGLVILSPLNRRPTARRWRDAFLATLPAAAIIGGWMLRSLYLTGCLTSCSNWKGAPAGFSKSIVAYGNEIGGWIFYLPTMASWRWALFLATMAALTMVLATLHRRTDDKAGPVAWLGLGLIALYSGFTIAVFSVLFLDEPMNQRYVLPLATLLVIPIAATVQALLPRDPGRMNRALALAVAAIWLGWLAAPAKSVWATMTHTHGLLALGPTTASRVVMQSDFVEFLKTGLPADNVVVTDDLTQAFTLIHSGRILPIAHPGQPVNGKTIIAADLPGGVAVGGQPQRYVPPPAARILYSGPFGAIFAISP